MSHQYKLYKNGEYVCEIYGDNEYGAMFEAVYFLINKVGPMDTLPLMRYHLREQIQTLPQTEGPAISLNPNPRTRENIIFQMTRMGKGFETVHFDIRWWNEMHDMDRSKFLGDWLGDELVIGRGWN